MSYNDGQVHTEFYNQKDNIEKVAEDFSEGDNLLKNSLLKLWENNIKTMACCKGHEEKESPAYISLIIDDNSYYLVKKITEFLYLYDGKIELDFENGNYGDSFSISMASEQDKNYFLNFLCLSLQNNEKNVDVNNNVTLYASYLLDFAKRTGLHCRYCVEKDKMMIGYNQPNSLQLFTDDAPHMNELLDSIVKTGNLPLTPIICDEESLEQFIVTLYPNSFVNQNNIVK